MAIQNKLSGAFTNSVSRTKHDGVDHYPTPPFVTASLLRHEDAPKNIWEPCNGDGWMSSVIRDSGRTVICTDLFDYPDAKVKGTSGVDFLSADPDFSFDGIITNPPYLNSNPEKFIRKALDYDCYIAFLCRLSFLEGLGRYSLFKKHPPKVVYAYSGRFSCDLNHIETSKLGGMTSYAWFVWEGSPKSTRLEWLNVKDEFRIYSESLK